jgi:hypothetical protein
MTDPRLDARLQHVEVGLVVDAPGIGHAARA